ncbi:30S ribosomal protein S11 [Nanoarchaeota archaeon]
MNPRNKDDRQSVIGIAYIYATYNNTIIHITDLANNTIAQISGGKATKHSRLKATPTVAMFAAKRAAEIAKEAGITDLYVKISSKAGASNPGPGANSAVKRLGKEGLRIINILDKIPMPRGGPKAKGGKRGRRV